MNYTTKIPLHQDEIKLIIRSFEDGDFEYFELEKEHPTTTHNGRGAAIWNNIFTQIEKNFNKKGFQVNTIRRGPWELACLYDEKSKYLYTFMRNDNFLILRNRKSGKKLYHYCSILGRINEKLSKTYRPEYEQMSFALTNHINEEDNENLNKILNEMVSKIKGEIVMYALVLIEQKRGIITNAECVIPIEGINTIYRESWKEFVGVNYDIEEAKYDDEQPIESEILLFNKETKPKLIDKEEVIKSKNKKRN